MSFNNFFFILNDTLCIFIHTIFMLNKNDHIPQKIVVLTLLLSLMNLGVHAQDWHLKKDEDGIKVFTANATNSDFKTIKVECTVSARPSQVVALLMDIQRQHEWVYNSKSAELIKVLGANEFISEFSPLVLIVSRMS